MAAHGLRILLEPGSKAYDLLSSPKGVLAIFPSKRPLWAFLNVLLSPRLLPARAFRKRIGRLREDAHPQFKTNTN